MTWWMAFTAIALAGPIERTDARTLGGSVIDEFAVLDLTTTHAAIKLVSHLDPELAGPDFGEPVNCGYAGMEKLPYSGVTLALEMQAAIAEETQLVRKPAKKLKRAKKAA